MKQKLSKLSFLYNSNIDVILYDKITRIKTFGEGEIKNAKILVFKRYKFNFKKFKFELSNISYFIYYKRKFYSFEKFKIHFGDNFRFDIENKKVYQNSFIRIWLGDNPLDLFFKNPKDMYRYAKGSLLDILGRDNICYLGQ